MLYFSEREHGESPRINHEISPTVWGGISSLIQRRIDDGSFGKSFPEGCPDNPMWSYGVNGHSFTVAIKAEIPALAGEARVWQFSSIDMPETTVILDVIEFCWEYVSKPEQGGYHQFFGHHHLNFDDGAGRAEFRGNINRIFRRNGVAFTLTEGGMIERTISETLSDELRPANFRTRDAGWMNCSSQHGRNFCHPARMITGTPWKSFGMLGNGLKPSTLATKNWAAKRCLTNRPVRINQSSGHCWNRKQYLLPTQETRCAFGIRRRYRNAWKRPNTWIICSTGCSL